MPLYNISFLNLNNLKKNSYLPLRFFTKQMRATHIRTESFILNNKVSPAAEYIMPDGCTSIIIKQYGMKFYEIGRTSEFDFPFNVS